MTNWREMEAGQELDVLVARLLGLNVHTADEAPADDLYGGWEFCTDREWHTAWFIDAEGSHPIPAYSTDLNAAWTLFADLPDDVTPRLVRILEARGDHMATVCKAGIIHNETHEQVEAYADTPALAICRAWLAWKEMQS